jgi:hypothetical protein
MKNIFQLKTFFIWFSGKCFSFYFRRKTLSESCEKFINIILFAYYIKFNPQIFDLYIYIYIYIYCFELFFFNFIP